MNRTLHFAALDFQRVLRDWSNLFFTIALPVFFYLVFGATQEYGDYPLPGGNATAYVMIGMALYGAIGATVASASSSVVEHNSGWGRQLALTPLTGTQIAFSQALNAFGRGVLPVLAVFITGALTGVSMPAQNWLITFIATALVAVPFAFYGLIWALMNPAPNTVSISSASIVLLAFAGNVFLALPESLAVFAKFTPMWGAGVVTRYPVLQEVELMPGMPHTQGAPLWQGILNIVMWTGVFVGICVMLRRKDKARA